MNNVKPGACSKQQARWGTMKQQLQRRRPRPAADDAPDEIPEVKPSKVSERAGQWLAREEEGRS